MRARGDRSNRWVALDLVREAIEALRAAIRARQQHVADRSADAAVAIIEWMDRDKPEVREPGLDERGIPGWLVDPAQERAHLGGQAIGRWDLIMNQRPIDAAGNDPHRALRIGPPAADRYLNEARVPGREESRVPAIQTLTGERGVVV